MAINYGRHGREWHLERAERVCGRVQINPPVPLAEQLVAQLAIHLDCYFEDGEMAPSIRLMSETLKLNRLTVLAAYQRLRKIGLLRAPRGQRYVMVDCDTRREALRALRDYMLKKYGYLMYVR